MIENYSAYSRFLQLIDVSHENVIKNVGIGIFEILCSN